VCQLICLLVAAIAFLSLEAPDASAAGSAASPAALTGMVGVAIEEDLDGGVRRQPILNTREGAVGLRLPLSAAAATGRAITVSRPRRDAGGAVVAGDVRMYGAVGQPAAWGAPRAVSDGSIAFSPGPRKVVVILIELGQGAPVAGAEAARQAVFTGTPSANGYFQEQTAGLVSLTGKQRADGDVYGPYPVTVFSNACSYTQWSEDADQAFHQQTRTWPFDVYDHVIYLFRAPQCQFSGIGLIGLQPGARSWINGEPNVSVISHELGHNFGADHSNTIDCVQAGARVPFGGACSIVEYGDPFTVMGQGGMQHETAYHKWESGWLPNANVLRVSKNGAYLIKPLEGSAGGVQLLEIPRGPGLESYWLDFRQPFGQYDAYASDQPIVNGVAVRMALRPDPAKQPQKTKLIDTTPQTTSFLDAPLLAGRGYAETGKGITISTVSVSAAGALVLVKLPGGTDAVPPSAPAGISGAVQGGTVTLSWGGASDDSGGVNSYAVSRDGAAVADTSATTLSDAPPGGRTHHYEVRAVDPSGNAGPPTAIDLYVPDTAQPGPPAALVVELAPNQVRLSWHAAPDDVGVESYLVQRDGQTIAANLTTLAHTVTGLGGGAVHTFAVRARDAAGNVGSPAGPVTVTVVGSPAVGAVKAATVTFKRRAVAPVRVRIAGGRVIVTWPKMRGALRYEVLRDKKVVATTRATRVTQRPSPLRGHRYQVRAVLKAS